MEIKLGDFGLATRLEYSEEKKKIEASREFKMPKYRTGYVVEMTLFQSLSEGKFNTIKGVVFSKI